MRITVFGAAGTVGSQVVTEALSRGHQVTAVVRDQGRFDDLPVAADRRTGDAADIDDVARLSAGQLEVCRSDAEADWTYLSPPAVLEPGERTGAYRLGNDELLVDVDGQSAISVADLAVALLDEVERPRHRRTRFTVARL